MLVLWLGDKGARGVQVAHMIHMALLSCVRERLRDPVPYSIEGTTATEIGSRDLKIQDMRQLRTQCRVCVLFCLESA